MCDIFGAKKLDFILRKARLASTCEKDFDALGVFDGVRVEGST